jgi:hypothetical protein
VLVFDIALRDFLHADDLELRMIDFANSAPLPPGTDVARANVGGGTARVDLFNLSNVVYSILAWREFSHRCEEAEWPNLDQMPDVSGTDYGQIVYDCWTKRYASARDLALEIRRHAKA